MLREGTRVTKMTRRVGQRAPIGTIVDVRSGSYEIEWDDGRRSITDAAGVVTLKSSKKR